MKSRLPVADLFHESMAGLLQRPSRSALTVLGTVLGIAAFVSVLGLTATAAGQLDRRFTSLMATEVVVEQAEGLTGSDGGMAFPADATARVERLNGVTHAGLWWKVGLPKPVFGASPEATVVAAGLSLIAIEPSALPAVHPRIGRGRPFDSFHQSRAERVALVGRAAASQIGITGVDRRQAVFVDGISYTVLGIVDDVERRPELLFSVMIPTSTALLHYGAPAGSAPRMLIETKIGAARLIASQAALAILPNAPQRLRVISPPNAEKLRNDIGRDLQMLLMGLAAVCLLVGAVGIANTTFISVVERAREIGLRRSLGAMPWHISAQFMAESAVLGVFGGLVGSTVGVAVVVLVAAAQGWTPLMQPWIVGTAPLAGLLVGALAGIYPAFRAARIQPLEALRR